MEVTVSRGGGGLQGGGVCKGGGRVVFQVENSVVNRPNYRGRRSQAIGAGVEHRVPNTKIHGESGPEK